MPRPIHTERRHLLGASRIALILAILISSGSVGIAAADGPTFLGTFTSVSMCSPRGIGLSTLGDVFLGSDCVNPHMEHFTSAGTLLATWTFPRRYLGSPNGVAMDGSDNVFVTDYDGGMVLKYSSSGALITSWGGLSQAVALAVDGSGNVYALDPLARQVKKFTTNGSLLLTFGSMGSGPGQFQDPAGIALDASGRIYVADYTRDRILRFLPDGTFDMEFTTPVRPTDVAVGPDGNLYVVSFDVAQGYEFSPDGVPLLAFEPPDGFDGAFRIAIGATGAMYVSEQYHTRIARFQIDQTTAALPLTFGRLKAMYR